MAISEEDLKEFSTLLAADLEIGDIEKVAGLFQYNTTLYETLGKLLTEGSMFVRLGVNLLLEDLKEAQPQAVIQALPILIPLLKSDNPTIRGDVADLIGMIGSRQHIDLLKPLLADEHSQVRGVVAEAIATLEESEI
jgi:predicted component of type VI protein secretion system